MIKGSTLLAYKPNLGPKAPAPVICDRRKGLCLVLSYNEFPFLENGPINIEQPCLYDAEGTIGRSYLIDEIDIAVFLGTRCGWDVKFYQDEPTCWLKKEMTRSESIIKISLNFLNFKWSKYMFQSQKTKA